MDFFEWYYSVNIIDEDNALKDEEKIATQKTMDYLKDCKISTTTFENIILKLCDFRVLTPKNLPKKLWENSLIEPETYYYHNSLHIVSPAPIFNIHTKEKIVSDFYLEMKIMFTKQDLLDYYKNNVRYSFELYNNDINLKTVDYLFNRYKKIKKVKPLDFILFLIDEAANDRNKQVELYKITKYEDSVYKKLKKIVAESKHNKTNKIFWRHQWENM